MPDTPLEFNHRSDNSGRFVDHYRTFLMSNEVLCDVSNGDIFDREGFLAAIENGKYPEYTIAFIDGGTVAKRLDQGIRANITGAY